MSAVFDSSLFPSDRPFVSPETFDAFFVVMDRLDATIASENEALARHDLRRLSEFARQKRQGLLELDRIMRALRSAIPNGEMIARLARFRERSAENQAALRVELDASAAVAEIIMGAMRDLESDGTYSRAPGRYADDDP